MIVNVFSGGEIDRRSDLRKDPGSLAALLARDDALWLPVWRSLSLITHEGRMGTVPRAIAERWIAKGHQPVFLGFTRETPCFALDVSKEGLDEAGHLLPGASWADLRLIGATLPRDEAGLLALARGMAHWHTSHLYCGRCGHATESADGGFVRRCVNPDCKTDHFPRTDPAVIVLVEAEGHCLLGRAGSWPEGRHSTLAGFVEPGETPEEAVRREVFEETGVKVGPVTYHSSQPWPFPSSLMIGFFAKAERRIEPKIDKIELESAAWFTREEIRRRAEAGSFLPNRQSIAYRLIQDWLALKS